MLEMQGYNVIIASRINGLLCIGRMASIYIVNRRSLSV